MVLNGISVECDPTIPIIIQIDERKLCTHAHAHAHAHHLSMSAVKCIQPHWVLHTAHPKLSIYYIHDKMFPQQTTNKVGCSIFWNCLAHFKHLKIQTKKRFFKKNQLINCMNAKKN